MVLLFLLITACSNSILNLNPRDKTSRSNADLHPYSNQRLPPVTPTPQPLPLPATYGPDTFPQGFNPLSGQRVSDPARLEYPAILLSISHFPPAARPQAGLSFAPFVYEYYITEGSTRHVAVVYGEFPAPEIPLHGDCKVRAEPMTQTDTILGNRVWQDKNGNGIQDPREGGIGGICVDLLDANGKSLGQTTTDSNGYYAFNVKAGKYIIEFEKPAGWSLLKRMLETKLPIAMRNRRQVGQT